MPDQRNNIKPFNWVIISALGFVVFLGMAIAFSIYSDKLNLISPSTYFFLLVVLALIAAGFLFGAMRSHAKYSGKAYNGTLELSGPVVVLALIIFLGYKFRPTENSFSTTVNFFSNDSSHATVAEGEVTVYYGAAHVSRKISEGQVILNEIPKEFRGREVTFIPVAEGYSAKAQKAILPANGNVLELYLEKVKDSVTITGIVLTDKGKAINNAVVVFADGLAKDSTDRFGNFRIRLPLKDGDETQVRVYKNDELKYNNLVRVSNQSPLSIQITK
jgi:co-chaperonin GroES (HSP10)